MKKVIFHLCDLVRREEGEGESIVSLTEGRLRAGVQDIKEGGRVEQREGDLNEHDHDSYQSQFSIAIIIISSCIGINMSSCSSVVRSGSGRKLILLSRPATKILQEVEKTKRETVFYSFSLIKVKHPITKMVYSEGTRLRRLKSYGSEHVKN